MRHYLPLLLLLLPAGLLLTAGGAKGQVYRCHSLSWEPVLDGNLDEPAWNGVPEGTGFVKPGGDALASKQTFFRMGYTPAALFIGIRHTAAEVDTAKAATEAGDIWSADSVELFLFPKGADNYFQFVVSAMGARWNGIGLGGPEMPLADWSAKTDRGKDCWSVEIKMPWEIFLALPEKGEEWRGNVCRNIHTAGDDCSCWAHLKTFNFHEPENFGKIIFEDELPVEAGSAISNFIRKKTCACLEPIADEEQAFAEAGRKHPCLRQELAAFLKDYEKIKTTMAQGNALSVKEEAALLRTSGKLSVRSDTLRGKILKERLFD